MMMNNRAVVVIMAAVVAASVLMAEGWKESEVLHLSGQVLCQDCTQGWNEWAHGGKPIKGCRVSVTCMDGRRRIVYYGSDETDEAGNFEMVVNKYVNGKELNTRGCFVRLVSSPDPVCNIATDFAGGLTGVSIGRPNVVYRDITKHQIGPFYYTTPMCDEPDTTEAPDEKADDNDNDNSSY